MSDENRLLEHFKALDFGLPTEPFVTYLKLMIKWNNAYNLTAIRELEQMVTHHIMDSLAILPWINGTHILDVGTGPGLPGIPLAIANPNLQVVLLDSNGKKIRFLREVKRVLSLNNVEIVESRVEAYHPPKGFDTVTSRAFSDLQTFIHWTKHLLANEGIWLAMKGRHPKNELADIINPYHVKHYSVPGLIGERCCVIIENKTS